MSPPGSQTQWYLAREGQQFGPISEAELAKFIELGHLQPNDLVWREGFPDWRPALVVFPPSSQVAPATMAAPMRTAAQAPQASRREPAGRRRTAPATSAPPDDEEQAAPGRGRGRLLGVLIAVVVVIGAGWFAYTKRNQLAGYVPALSTLFSSFSSSQPGAGLDIADRKSLEVPPFAGLRGSPEAIDAKMQSAALWRVIKREFPDWYSQRLNEVAALARENKDDAAIAQHLAGKIVQLRRQQVGNALSATLPKLKSVATIFHENLTNLRKQNAEACYGLISQGEAHPLIISLLGGSQHTAHLQAQLTGVFEAIAEGRKQPRVYPIPKQADYDRLASDLAKLGWTGADIQLFSDERALSKAEPAKVCQMVHDWFTAQLQMKDTDGQMRLLVESLRPVIAG
jgi:hypothetical protein